MRNVRETPESGASPTSELEPITPIAPVAVPSAGDARRRRRYMQIAFGLAALVVALVVLYLLRDFLGAFVLGAAIAFLIQPAVSRLHAVGIPRPIGIAVVFVAMIVAIGGLIL